MTKQHLAFEDKLCILRRKYPLYMAPQLLNAVFDSGNSIGEILAYTFCLMMAIEIGYVFVKYVITTDR